MGQRPFEQVLSGNAAFRLPLRLDPRPLAAEAAALRADAWDLKCYRQRDSYSHAGTWRTLTLRGPHGPRPAGKYDIATTGPFADTAVLRRSPRLRQAIASIPGGKTAVQLFKLQRDGAVTRHVDPIRRYRGRELAPVHLVVTTNPSVRFFVNGQPLRMRPGEVWALNATLPHEVYNTGRSDRVHMILHLVYDDAVADLFARAERLPAAPAADFRAAKAFADGYLARARFDAATALETPRRAARRRAAVVAQLLRMGAA